MECEISFVSGWIDEDGAVIVLFSIFPLHSFSQLCSTLHKFIFTQSLLQIQFSHVWLVLYLLAQFSLITSYNLLWPFNHYTPFLLCFTYSSHTLFILSGTQLIGYLSRLVMVLYYYYADDDTSLQTCCLLFLLIYHIQHVASLVGLWSNISLDQC